MKKRCCPLYQYENDLNLIVKLYIQAIKDIKKRLYCNYYFNILQESQQQNGSTKISSSIATTSDITSQEYAETGVERAVTGEKNDAAKQVRTIFERENYACEAECKNTTFNEKESGKPYMELTYLIPISEQKDFSNSLDIDENKICLCTLCNLKLHKAIDSEREEILVKLYYKHREQLKKAGIEISLIQLFKYYNFGDVK